MEGGLGGPAGIRGILFLPGPGPQSIALCIHRRVSVDSAFGPTQNPNRFWAGFPTQSQERNGRKRFEGKRSKVSLCLHRL